MSSASKLMVPLVSATLFARDVCISSNFIKDPHTSATESSTFTMGQRVSVNFKGRGKWFPGTIEKVRGFGVYDVTYDPEILPMLQEESIIWPESASSGSGSAVTENDRTYTRSMVMSISNTEGLSAHQRNGFLSHTAVLLGILGSGDSDSKSSKDMIYLKRSQ